MMDKYVKVKKLGSGSFGNIYLVRHVDDGCLYVLKSIDLKTLDKKQRRDALKEIQILSQFTCDYIIKYKEYFYSNIQPDAIPTQQRPSAYDAVSQQTKQRSLNRSMDNTDLSSGSILYIIMEYADGGDVDQKIKRQAKVKGQLIDEQTVLKALAQVCIALQQIHTKHIIHRDIKSENIFLMSNGDVKVGDFGISKSLQNTLAQAQTRIGTPYYLSPEICLNKPYSYKTDVWSVGVVLYELMTLQHPFDGSSMENLLKNIVKSAYNPVSKQYSVELRKLLDSCLQKIPDRRPTIAQILKSPILAPYVKLYSASKSNGLLSSDSVIKSSSQPSLPAAVQSNNENTDSNKKPLQTHLPSIHQQPQQQQYVLHHAPQHIQHQPLSQPPSQQQQHRTPLTDIHNRVNSVHQQQQARQLTPVDSHNKQLLNRIKEQQRLNTLAAVRSHSPSQVHQLNRLQHRREQERVALEAELAQIRAKYMAEQQQTRFGVHNQQPTPHSTVYTSQQQHINHLAQPRYRTPAVQSTVQYSRYATPSVSMAPQYGIASVPPSRKHHFIS